MFSNFFDEAFDNAPILRQYQASLISALAPAWDAEAPAELGVGAIVVVGRLTASRVIADSVDMARLVKILDDALRICSGKLGVFSNLRPFLTSCIQAKRPI